ncbi:cyclic nucleotide-binding domain containing protein [Babesia caballi]|uniref:Cyclic nucleotide-binding domain containing protein n=1 Tax=Babesia caballi TaxID=5871 RepID=A0AAV4LSL0_BABCB|nr:cyclic nucleotide-binding domain containing protein [Babesia caballi]
MHPDDKCACAVKLAQLYATVLDDLHPCKEQVHEARVSHLQGTIDALQLRNDDLREQLAQIHSKIASDPFLSNKFQGALATPRDESSQTLGLDLHSGSNPAELYRQLCVLADRNRELEDRLSSEQAISMSWKHKIHDIEQRLRSQLDELIDITKDVSCIKDAECAKARSDRREALTKEAFDLLRLARVRIAGDKTRIESFMNRIAELEKELAEHRLRSPDAANQVNSLLPSLNASEPRLSRAPPPDSLITQDTCFQDSTPPGDVLVHDLAATKAAIHSEPWKFYADYTLTGQSELPKASGPPAPTPECAERRRLIGLYSDILTLIKTNQTPIALPVSQAHGTQSPTVTTGTHPKETKVPATLHEEEPQSGLSSIAEYTNLDDTDQSIPTPEEVNRTPSSVDAKSNTTLLQSENSFTPQDSILSQSSSVLKSSIPTPSAASSKLESPERSPRGSEGRSSITPDRLESIADSPSERFVNLASNMTSSSATDHTVLLSSSSADNASDDGSNTCDDSHADTLDHSDFPDTSRVTTDVAASFAVTRDSAHGDATSSLGDAEVSAPPSLPSLPSGTPSESAVSSDHFTDMLQRNAENPASSVTDASTSNAASTVDLSGHENDTHEEDCSVLQSLQSVTLDTASQPSSNPELDERDSSLLSLSSISYGEAAAPTPFGGSEHGSDLSRASGGSPTDPILTFKSGHTRSDSGVTLSASGTGSFLGRSDTGAHMSEQRRHMLDALLLVLESVPVLKELPEDRLYSLLRHFRLKSYHPLASIIIAGERPRYFYVISSGMVSSYSYEGFDAPNRLLRRYLNGDYFGELALINDRVYDSYMVAEGYVTVYAMRSDDFKEHLSDLFPRFRECALAEHEAHHAAPSGAPDLSLHGKAAGKYHDIAAFMKLVPILSVAPQLEDFVQSLGYREYTQNEVIAGSVRSLRDFCIVYKGKVTLHLDEGDHGNVCDFATLGPTSFIGGFRSSHPQVARLMESASLVAADKTVLLTVNFATLRKHLKNAAKHVGEYVEQIFLDKMHERELLQTVEKFSARVDDGTHFETSPANSNLSSDDSDIDKAIAFSPSPPGDPSSESDHARGYQSDPLMSSDMSALESDASSALDSDFSDSIASSAEDVDEPMDSNMTPSTPSSAPNDLASVANHSDRGSSELTSPGSSLPSSTTQPLDVHGSLPASSTSSLLTTLQPSGDPSHVIPSELLSDDEPMSLHEPDSDAMDTDSFSSDGLESLRSDVSKLSDSGSDASKPADSFETDIPEDDNSEKGQGVDQQPRPGQRKRLPTGFFAKGPSKAKAAVAAELFSKVSDSESPYHAELHTTSSTGDDDHAIASHDLDTSVGLADLPESDSDDLPGSYSEGYNSDTPKFYEEDQLEASKDLLIATLKCKCSSLGAAFNFMDSDHCGVVFRTRFYDWIEEVGIASIEKDELPFLFDALKEPDRDVMTVASLYRNSGERVTTAKDLCARLQHVHGSSRVAFEKQFGPLKISSTCAEADFALLAANVGVSEDDAAVIFKELDVCGNGYVTVVTMLKLMRGDWTLDVAREKEAVAVSNYNQVAGYWGSDEYEQFHKEFSNSYVCVFDILEYGVDVSQVDATWEELTVLSQDFRGLTDYIDPVILPAVRAQPYFEMLSVVQKRFIASLFVDVQKESGCVVVAENAGRFSLYIVLAGTVQSSYTTYLYTESAATDLGPGSWLGFDCFQQRQRSVCTYKVPEGGSALLGYMPRALFDEAVAPMVAIRAKRVPVIAIFLSKVPCLQGLDPADVERIARASVVRKRKMHETVFREGADADWVYVVYDGFVDIRVRGEREHVVAEVSTTGLLGAEEVSRGAAAYLSSAVVSSATLLLIGWPAPAFASVFGAAAARVREATHQASAAWSRTLQRLEQESKRASPKAKKAVAFSNVTTEVK